ncbi:probable peptidyl-tRNA hydrolase 2 isoform X2 [Paramacrobiotus metropolitanus]|uniref:probable peptidyl-tRNA hydrolase 2 isoform X2 n=1 Tax=Paramacrobiotus metropolitanus TaxID=2943436 RepID=UPI002445CCB5|nr:probable peptidyl-tRNA hydrolase 2 isoform X2 [Paramacrobiotus metropolitanus]
MDGRLPSMSYQMRRESMASPTTFPNPDFQPNPESMRELAAMGFDQETAAQALYFSGNRGTDTAVTWIFDNQGQSPPALEPAFPRGNFGGPHWEENWEGLDAGGAASEGGEYKMVILINTSLRMTAGKIAAQAAHAAIGIYRAIESEDEGRSFRSGIRSWEREGETTIVLAVDDAPHLEALERRAKDRGLVAMLISDAGRTQVAIGAKTALGLFGGKIQD